jgi:hypothetical protein
MTDQTARLEAATVKAEVGSAILSQFSNNAAGLPPIPTLAGSIPALADLISTIQTAGSNKISFATKIYATTAAGIAATVDQEIFLVQSSSSNLVYNVYQNVSGTATDTGKSMLTSAAITTEVGLATTAATAAQASAATATARVAGFHSPSATAPTTRDDGSALQIGDRYFNTTVASEFIYTSGGWINNSFSDIDGGFY